MNKKEQLRGAFDSFLSKPQPQPEEATVVEQRELKKEGPVVENNKRGRGRPKKEENPLTGKDMRTSLIVNENKYKLIEAIAKKEGLTKKELLDTALDIIIEGYEKKHGKIKPLTEEERDLKSLFV